MEFEAVVALGAHVDVDVTELEAESGTGNANSASRFGAAHVVEGDLRPELKSVGCQEWTTINPTWESTGHFPEAEVGLLAGCDMWSRCPQHPAASRRKTSLTTWQSQGSIWLMSLNPSRAPTFACLPA